MMSTILQSEKMESENFRQIFCRLCFNIISDKDFEIIGETIMRVLELVLPKLNLEERHKHVMCKVCSVKLYDAFNFKSKCMDTESIIFSHVNSSRASQVDLKAIYLKRKRSIHLTDISDNERVCRLCLQLVPHKFVPLNEMDIDIINTYIPQINISATKNPVICGPCFDELYTHGGFLKNCLDAQETYENVNNKLSYVKFEETEIKLEDDQYMQKEYKNIDKPSHIKFEEIKMKLEDGQNSQKEYKNIDKQSYTKSKKIEIKLENVQNPQGRYQDHDIMSYIKSEDVEIKADSSSSCILHGETIGNQKRYISQNGGEIDNKTSYTDHQSQEHFSETDTNKSDIDSYQTKYKEYLKVHKSSHKDFSEIRIYKCDMCTYETEYKSNLTAHQLKHKKNSEIETYKCALCSHVSKRRKDLKTHQLIHRKSSEVRMYKCDMCSHGTKYKSNLKTHKLTHKVSPELQQKYLKSNELAYTDPYKIRMYTCDPCGYETKCKDELKSHQLLHEDSSDNQMYI